MRPLAVIFKGLSDETRLSMLALVLEHGELCVCDFVEALGITQSKASRHLRCLHHAGLLADRKDGLWVHYRLAPGLDKDRTTILAALRKLLSGDRTEDIERKLARWMGRKKSPAGVCATACRGRSVGTAALARPSRRGPRQPARTMEEP